MIAHTFLKVKKQSKIVLLLYKNFHIKLDITVLKFLNRPFHDHLGTGTTENFVRSNLRHYKSRVKARKSNGRQDTR